MKRVLILSYYFPPLGMGGTQRILGFMKHLPAYGWEPTVLTVRPVVYFAHDDALLDSVPVAQIVRTGSLDPLRLLRKLRKPDADRPSVTVMTGGPGKAAWRAINFVTVPDNKVLWNPFAGRQARKMLAGGSFEALLSSGPPHSTHLLARRLAREYELPWIADFRDGWANGDFQPGQTALHAWADKFMQRKVVRDATAITAVSRGLAGELGRTLDNPDKISVITNGYDREKFSREPNPDRRFDVVHIGTVGNFVDPVPLMHAFTRLVQDGSLTPQDARLHFVGQTLGTDLMALARSLEIEHFVHATGYVPHAEAVKALQQADLLAYLISGTPSQGFIPGKTFEYLAVGKPVLAMAAEVEGLQLLRQAAWLRHVAPDDVDHAANALKAFFVEFRSGRSPARTPQRFEAFTRKQLTRRLAGILDTIAGGSPAEQRAPRQVSHAH